MKVAFVAETSLTFRVNCTRILYFASSIINKYRRAEINEDTNEVNKSLAQRRSSNACKLPISLLLFSLSFFLPPRAWFKGFNSISPDKWRLHVNESSTPIFLSRSAADV